jgi:TolB protein
MLSKLKPITRQSHILLVLFVLLITTLLLGHANTLVLAQTESPNIADNLTGSIAYVGQDYNVFSFNLTQNETHQLTTDGNTTQRYQWATWSPDGRLAYFCCDLEYAQSAETMALISADGQQDGKIVFEGFGESVIYAAWSPGNCDGDITCRDLALLINDVFAGTLSVELIRDYLNQNAQSSLVGTGSPFYYTWNPAGDALLMHRNNRSIDTYELADNSFTNVEPSSGAFQTPAWSPVDDRLLLSIPSRIEGEEGSALVIRHPDGRIQPLLSGIRGLSSFLWSPDGRYVAYRIINERLFGSVFVIDAQTGETISRSTSNGVIAFFWSPDSHKLAYVTLATPNGTFSAQAPTTQISQRYNIAQPTRPEIEMAWSTLNIPEQTNTRHTNFIPTDEMLYLLLYFDQFAPSHRIWSPDSTHITYAELTDIDNAQSSISILNTLQNDSIPLTIANGVFSVWSFQ